MLSVFNIVRLSAFVSVVAFSLIVLGLAAFFDHIIVENDLTRFIPLAIFVAVCTLIIIPTLLLFGVLKRVLLISQVRSELTFVGLLGLLWSILGIYTSIEPETIIMCDFDPGDFFELAEGAASGDAPYSNDTYQLQYRVLKAFAILNALLLVSYSFFVLLLALRQHHLGRKSIWTSGITSIPFFTAPKEDPSQEKALMGSGRRRATETRQAADRPPLARQPSRPTPPSQPQPQPQSSPVVMSPMKPGGQYIMYIPPPPPPRKGR